MNKYNKEGKRDGQWESYYSNGNLSYRFNYINGIINGLYESYYSNNVLHNKGNCINGKRDGYWIENYYNDPHTLYLNI